MSQRLLPYASFMLNVLKLPVSHQKRFGYGTFCRRLAEMQKNTHYTSFFYCCLRTCVFNDHTNVFTKQRLF